MYKLFRQLPVITVVFFSFAEGAHAQTYLLKGRVTDDFQNPIDHVG